MKPREQKKNDGIIGIIFSLILVVYTANTYNLTHTIFALFCEIACILLLFVAIFNYTKIRKPKKKKAKKKAKTKIITPFDKKFKRNYKRIHRKQKQDLIPSDNKIEYIQSAWDELNKI